MSKKILATVLRAVVSIVIVALLLLVLYKNDFSLTQTEHAHKFGASYMTLNNPFFEVINASIKTAVEANGDVLITRDPALDADRQVDQIYQLIDEGIEGLFLVPVDYDAVVPAVEAAKKKGITVIIVDTEVYNDDLADGMVVSDNYLAGQICAEYLMEQKSNASIVLLEHTRTKSGNDRVKGFVDTIAGNENYKVVASEDAMGQLEVAMPLVQKLVNDGTKFDTVFAINDVSALGAMAALEDDNMLSGVTVLGVDGAPEAKAMIKEGLMLATVAQYPSKIGEYAAEQMYSILEGKDFVKKILVPVELVTENNVEAFGTKNWQ